MVNIPGIKNRFVPDKEKPQSAECPPDNKLPENSQENLDARLDHAIEETFPTSDPVSVTITKGAGVDPHGRETAPASRLGSEHQSGQDATGHVLDQVREALNDVAGSASAVAGTAYRQGERYARQVGEQYPQAQHYAREAQRLAARHATGNPLLSPFVAGAIGYALAWMIHGERRNRDRHVPDYAKTRHGYASQGDA
jgi:hypothetical protein